VPPRFALGGERRDGVRVGGGDGVEQLGEGSFAYGAKTGGVQRAEELVLEWRGGW